MFEHIGSQFAKAVPAKVCRHACKTTRDHLVRQTDHFEDLRATVTVNGRDAHLGHHLEQTFFERMDVVLLGFVRQFAGGTPVVRFRRFPRTSSRSTASARTVASARYGLTASAPMPTRHAR